MKLSLYAVLNSAGLWFRSKGYGGYGESWVSELQRAKLYAKIGQARARVSFFANLRPDLPAPELVEFVVTELGVVDETKRVERIKERKRTEKQRRAVSEAKRQREDAERRLRDAQEELLRLERPRLS